MKEKKRTRKVKEEPPENKIRKEEAYILYKIKRKGKTYIKLNGGKICELDKIRKEKQTILERILKPKESRLREGDSTVVIKTISIAGENRRQLEENFPEFFIPLKETDIEYIVQPYNE